MDKEKLLRPRWGTFSVIDHQDPAALVPEVLLYDRLVFPTPVDDKDRQRWESNNWRPDLLDQRIKELGDLAHQTPWTQELRDKWSERWERLKSLGKDTKGLAMGLTPRVLAMSVWQDQFPPPIMIAAYQDADAARADLALTDEPPAAQKDKDELHREVAALFERRLEMPVAADAQRTYEKAIELAHDQGYQNARRSLFEWEDQRVAAGWPTRAAIKELEELVDAHDDLIKKHFKQTWKRRIFYAVQFVAPAILAAATANPFVGLASGGALKLVEARFPSITADPGAPQDSPGAAAHQAINFMFHDAHGAP